MNIQRFQAPTSREAMAKARAAFGDSAVILSSRATSGGFEVVATTEENLATLPVGNNQGNSQPVALKPASERARAVTAAPAPRQAERPSTVERDTETMAMSTLSFQDYVRERMLKRRKEALEGRPAAQPAAQAPMQATGQGSAGVFAQAAASMPPVAPRRSLAERAALGDLPAQQRLAPAPRPEMHAPIVTREMEHDLGRNTPARDLPRATSHDDWAAAMVMPRADMNLAPTASAANISGELSALKDMIEDRFNMLAWLGTSRNNPLQSNLMLKLIRAGYSPALVRSVLERLPADSGPADAVRWVMDVYCRAT
jgi:flagellar biosynthesis protein FlhF